MKYSFPVIKGHGRGEKLGYPTFNLSIPEDFNEKFGVYTAFVWIRGKKYLGALHFGPLLTFDEAIISLEIFVLDYDNDQIIEKVDFELLSYLRPIKKFESEKELSAQIAEDIKNIRRINGRRT
jgi:riboflavin kinase/FMN adenylyltransferase